MGAGENIASNRSCFTAGVGAIARRSRLPKRFEFVASWREKVHVRHYEKIRSFKPQLQLETRGQGGQNETEQPSPAHSASLSNSITPTQASFLVHTARTNLLIMFPQNNIGLHC